MNSRPIPPTLLLRERRPRECRLARADVDFLLAEHRAHVEVVPTRERGRYRLTPLGHVGTIVAPRRRLVIRPKIPLVNLFHLLDPTTPVPVVEDRTHAVAGAEALDFLGARLVRLLAERAAAGLHRGYAERSSRGAFLQGRLDVPAQLRSSAARKDMLHGVWDDFTADVPCNQVPRAVAELVLRSPLTGATARAAVRRALADFDGVSAIDLGPDAFALALPDRLTEAYRPLLDLCRLLADALAPGEAPGRSACPAFLIDMGRVFEGYVTRALADDPRLTVEVQPRRVANEPAPGQPDIHVRPDVVLMREGRPEAVVDAKWKSLAGSPLVTEDVYQALAYCSALGVGRGVLVYPGRRDRAWTYRIAAAPVTLVIHTLRVVGGREALRRGVRRLSRSFR